jgi:hypothetical protein
VTLRSLSPADADTIARWAWILSFAERLTGPSTCRSPSIGVPTTRGEAGRRVGDSRVHFDPYPHNVLLTRERVVFVDWPHARLGAPIVDLLIVLSSAATDGINPEPVLRNYAANADLDEAAIDAVPAAHAGFLLSGALSPTPPGLAAIAAAKLHLGLGAVIWLQRRLASRA